MEQNSIGKTMKQLKQAMLDDSNYAWTWHCNLAMCVHDEGVDHKTANMAAARMMQHIFNVDTSKFEEYKAFGYE